MCLTVSRARLSSPSRNALCRSRRFPGEKTSPTQPFPTKPLPFDRQGITLDDVIDFTPELRREARRILDKYDYGSLFTPPTEKGTIVLPGVGGVLVGLAPPCIRTRAYCMSPHSPHRQL
jgi:hypothetical protein